MMDWKLWAMLVLATTILIVLISNLVNEEVKIFEFNESKQVKENRNEFIKDSAFVDTANLHSIDSIFIANGIYSVRY